MPCSKPITVQSPHGLIQVRCKQCLPCRIMTQRSLSLRGLLEFQTSWSAEFLTLTYTPEECPDLIDYSHFSAYLKRLRSWNRREGNQRPIRFLACGEYGGRFGRPHFHAILFNHLTHDPDCHTRLWRRGFVHIGQVTPSSIAYTARYTLKSLETPGKEPVCEKSRKPVLGDAGMRHIARHLWQRWCRGSFPRDIAQRASVECPSALRIEGQNYMVDQAMRKVFQDEIELLGGVVFAPHAISAVLKRREHLLFGDPLQAKREKAWTRSKFWDSIAVIKEVF